MKISFLKDWSDEPSELFDTEDGIIAAIRILASKHDLTFYTRKPSIFTGALTYTLKGVKVVHLDDIDISNQVNNCDVLLSWGSLDRPWHQKIQSLKIPKILLFAGGPTDHYYLRGFNHVCVESRVYEEAFKAQGVSVSRSFGTNTEVFFREGRTPKVFDALYPASFCFHKNQELFARSVDSRGLAVGRFNEPSIVGKCLQLGTPVLGRVSSASLCNLYNMCYTTVVPCGTNGGAQRVVLESMACGTPVIVASDNDKCVEFVKESGFGRIVEPVGIEIREAIEELISHPLDPQIGLDYIQSKWTQHHYAKSLEEAINLCLK